MKLNTFDQVFEFLNAPTQDWENVELGDSLFTVRIHIEGDRYKATIPGSLLKSLNAYQDAIYRIYAMAQYGSENIKNLTNAEKEALNVWFSVSQGSSEIEGVVAKFIAFILEALRDMEPKERIVCIILLALIFGGIVITPELADDYREFKIAEITQEGNQKAIDALSLSLHNQDKALDMLKTAQNSTNEAQEQVVKGAPHASHITIGKKEYKEEDIKQIQSSKRNPSESKDSVLDNVLVTGIIRSDDEDRIYTVEIKTETGEKYRFNAVMDTLRLDDEAYDARAHKVLFESFLNKKPISVTINVRTYRDKSTRQQLIDAFFPEDDL